MQDARDGQMGRDVAVLQLSSNGEASHVRSEFKRVLTTRPLAVFTRQLWIQFFPHLTQKGQIRIFLCCWRVWMVE